MVLADNAPDWVPDFVASLTVGHVVTFIVSLVIVVGFFKKIRPFFEGIRNFLEDWAGSDARPGVDKRPGVMERLDKLEKGLTSANSEIQSVNKQLHPNGGSSVADKVNQIKEVIIPTQRSEP